MKHGDFTELAKFYINRPGYSLSLLECLKNNLLVIQGKEKLTVADVGAGTGKLTENLEELGLSGYAVEPNDAMREEGIRQFSDRKQFEWLKGAAEVTNLPDNSVDWVLMGSSFHWADAPIAMAEFYRILKPNGLFTAIWNPRDISNSSLHQGIEDIVYKEIPNIKRVSSGNSITMEDMVSKMLFNGLFKDILFMEAPHVEIMSKERYMNTWKSVNDIQVQAGEEGFKRILDNIEEYLKNYEQIEVPYKSRAWTVKSTK